jgi:putative transposase
MFDLFRIWLGAALRFFRARQDLMLENLALRQQLFVLKCRYPKPRLGPLDKLFWVALRGLWSDWKNCLYLVAPDTVSRWHRAGFRLYWAMLCKMSSRVGGGKRISKEIRQLIFQMVAENSTWGAPRIHGELSMLGIGVSERTISRWMRRAPRNPEPAKRWLTFLHNHREAIAAMDFFTVPTLTFNLLCCFFIISHDRRRILHFNVTRHPTSNWIVQQLREAFPYQSPPKFLLFDHDQKYGQEVSVANSFHEHIVRANLYPESLAKRRCRALGRKLSAGSPRPWHHSG